MATRRGLIQLAGNPRSVGRRAPDAAADPDFASVGLLLDFAGADEATDITDLSNSVHVDTFVGNAKIDTTQQFLEVNSLELDGVGDYIHFPQDADWDFGTGDFTVEFGIRLNTTSIVQTPVSQFRGDPENKGFFFQIRGTVSEILIGWGAITFATVPWAPVTNTWYHAAATRSGTDVRVFIDGAQIGSTATDSTDMTGATRKWFIGVLRDDAVTQEVDGFIGAVRITKGVGRYTANFTPPTVFYPTS